jgi:hypothetical protein
MKFFISLLLGLLLVACASTDDLQLSNGKGKSFIVNGRSYEQIWRAATVAMSTDMQIVDSHKPSGVIKSRVVNGTQGKVVGFFIQPTDEQAPQYTITIVSKKPLQTEFVDRDWEPSVWNDFNVAIEMKFRDAQAR